MGIAVKAHQISGTVTSHDDGYLVLVLDIASRSPVGLASSTAAHAACPFALSCCPTSELSFALAPASLATGRPQADSGRRNRRANEGTPCSHSSAAARRPARPCWGCPGLTKYSGVNGPHPGPPQERSQSQYARSRIRRHCPAPGLIQSPCRAPSYPTR